MTKMPEFPSAELVRKMQEQIDRLPQELIVDVRVAIEQAALDPEVQMCTYPIKPEHETWQISALMEFLKGKEYGVARETDGRNQHFLRISWK